jgi:hypothetical protein
MTPAPTPVPMPVPVPAPDKRKSPTTNEAPSSTKQPRIASEAPSPSPSPSTATAMWPSDDKMKEMMEKTDADDPRVCFVCYQHVGNVHGGCGHLMCPSCLTKMRTKSCPQCNLGVNEFHRIFHAF